MTQLVTLRHHLINSHQQITVSLAKINNALFVNKLCSRIQMANLEEEWLQAFSLINENKERSIKVKRPPVRGYYIS